LTKAKWRSKIDNGIYGGYEDEKVYFIVLVVTFVSAQVMAQSRPIMGYDQVAFGSSVQTVRTTYNIGDTIVLEPAANDTNIMVLKQTNVSDTIQERQFMFNGDKLYRVWVIYKDTSDTTAQNLQSVLANRFGNRTDYNMDTGTTYLMFQQLRYTQETSTFGRYSPELVVELIHTVVYAGYEKDVNNLLGQNSLRICYTWKKFRDEYQASKLGL
jgi:hypothetical protein